MDVSRCKEVCRECHTICTETAVHHLATGGGDLRDHVRLLWDCSDICIAAADFLARGSEHHREICRACAVVCDACSRKCGEMDDPIMKRCAQVCRECSGLCDEVARHRPAGTADR